MLIIDNYDGNDLLIRMRSDKLTSTQTMRACFDPRNE